MAPISEFTRRDLLRAGSRAAAVLATGSLPDLLWYDTVAHAHPPAIRAAVDTLGADRIILGTDFPYESGELFKHAISYISDAGLKQAEISHILDYNGAKVLGLA